MTTPPQIPGRMRVDQVEQHQHWRFRCDDRAGFLLSILWASDGDLHLSILADPDHEDYATNCQHISGSVRLRLPLIGGGQYEHLQPAIMDAMRAELAAEKARSAPKPKEACKKCGAAFNVALRVVQPRIPCTAGSYAPPEIRCHACCKATKGMWRVKDITPSEFVARSNPT